MAEECPARSNRLRTKAIFPMRRRAAYLVAFLFGCCFLRPVPALAQSAETIIEWNQALITTLSTPGASRPEYILHPACRALERRDLRCRELLQPCLLAVPRLRRLLLPTPRRTRRRRKPLTMCSSRCFRPSAPCTTACGVSIESRGGGPGPAGAAAGAAVAQCDPAGRAPTMGGIDRRCLYSLPSLPGYRQPVPPQNTAATFAHYQDVAPFVIGSRSQFRAGRAAGSHERTLCRGLQRDQADWVGDEHDANR